MNLVELLFMRFRVHALKTRYDAFDRCDDFLKIFQFHSKEIYVNTSLVGKTDQNNSVKMTNMILHQTQRLHGPNSTAKQIEN